MAVMLVLWYPALPSEPMPLNEAKAALHSFGQVLFAGWALVVGVFVTQREVQASALAVLDDRKATRGFSQDSEYKRLALVRARNALNSPLDTDWGRSSNAFKTAAKRIKTEIEAQKDGKEPVWCVDQVRKSMSLVSSICQFHSDEDSAKEFLRFRLAIEELVWRERAERNMEERARRVSAVVSRHATLMLGVGLAQLLLCYMSAPLIPKPFLGVLPSAMQVSVGSWICSQTMPEGTFDAFLVLCVGSLLIGGGLSMWALMESLRLRRAVVS